MKQGIEMSEFTEKELIQELEKLDNDEARIDQIRKDIDSGELRYKDICVYALAELVGLDFEDSADWHRSFLIYKRDFENFVDFKHPYAEHVSYLEGEVPQKRFLKLSKRAAEIIKKGKVGTDLRMQKREREIIIDKFSRAHADGFPDMVYTDTCVETSDGDYIVFSACIGDAGDIEDPLSPYDIELGNDFDFDQWIVIEEL
jgi:hypothetical protein